MRREKSSRKGKPQAATQLVESFAGISDWYHFAIVEILKTRREVSVQEIVDRLWISATEAQYSLRALALSSCDDR